MELDLWGSNAGLENDTVPAVDSSDLKKVWLLLQESRGVAIGEESAIGLGYIERICNSGVNVRAVWYRASLLLLPSARSGLLSRWTSEGTPIDAVFKVARRLSSRKASARCCSLGDAVRCNSFLTGNRKRVTE